MLRTPNILLKFFEQYNFKLKLRLLVPCIQVKMKLSKINKMHNLLFTPKIVL